MSESCHEDEDLGCSWLCFPSQEQLITIQKQETTERILEHESEAEVTPCSTDTKTDCIRRVRESSYVLNKLPFPHARERSPWASGSSNGKREPGGGEPLPSALWVTFQELLLWSHTIRDLTVIRRERLIKNQNMDLGRLSS